LIMNPWIYVVIGGLFETGWAVTLKMSDGFSDLPWTAATLVLLLISMVLLNKGLGKGLPAGSAYSVWVGIGAVGSVAAGMVLFGDSMSILKALFVSMILIGVIGIERTKSGADDAS
jgi:quaternary ammonium compound-resistance protein SugE